MRKLIQALAIMAALAGFFLVGPSVAANAAPANSVDVQNSANAGGEPPDWTPSNIGPLACDGNPHNNGPGGATVTTAIHLRTGPNAYCGAASSTLPVGTGLGGHCRAYSDAGNIWFFVSVGGEDPHGWIWSGNVRQTNTISRWCYE